MCSYFRERKVVYLKSHRQESIDYIETVSWWMIREQLYLKKKPPSIKNICFIMNDIKLLSLYFVLFHRRLEMFVEWSNGVLNPRQYSVNYIQLVRFWMIDWTTKSDGECHPGFAFEYHPQTMWPASREVRPLCFFAKEEEII